VSGHVGCALSLLALSSRYGLVPLLPTRHLARMTPGGRTLRLVPALTAALLIGFFAGCAAGRPTSLIRLREGYELLTAHCEARPPDSCTPVRVTGDPHDEEAWGFRARPAANALWKEPEVFYAVGDRARCDEVRAALGTPSEACWGPVYFHRN
jgi:hypothetical protein